MHKQVFGLGSVQSDGRSKIKKIKRKNNLGPLVNNG